MAIYIVLVALLGYLLIYCWFSIKVKSWVNVLTPQLILAIPTQFLSEIIYLYWVDDNGYDLSYFIVYTTYFLAFLFFVMGYINLRTPNWILSINSSIEYGWKTATFFMLAAVAVYMPILMEFADSLLDPRSIYIATRTGYGLSYYLSIILSYIYFILILFRKNFSGVVKCFAFLVVLIFSYLHGSKGQVIATLFIWTIWYFVVGRRNVGFLYFSLISSLIGIFGIVLFFSMLSAIDFHDLAMFIAGYADYSRNAVMLIEKETSAYFGRLLFEENLYSRIPRLLFPEKPKNFGGFELAQKYFPESFDLDQGVPSFGIGIYFADFNVAAMLILALANFFAGWLTKIMVVRIYKFNSPIDFIVLLFLCGIVLLPIGAGYLLPEHIFIAFIVYWFCRILGLKYKL